MHVQARNMLQKKKKKKEGERKKARTKQNIIKPQQIKKSHGSLSRSQSSKKRGGGGGDKAWRDRMLKGRKIQDNQEITKIKNRPKKCARHFSIYCSLGGWVIAVSVCMYWGETRFNQKKKKTLVRNDKVRRGQIIDLTSRKKRGGG